MDKNHYPTFANLESVAYRQRFRTLENTNKSRGTPTGSVRHGWAAGCTVVAVCCGARAEAGRLLAALRVAGAPLPTPP
jgi:hypothetical protein